MSQNTIADIITYVGVPLAVLGVLPTLYTCIKSLLSLRKIRKQLDRNGVSAITRSSLLSGIVEVEIQRHSITPLERADPQYFDPNQHPSSLDGGSWTLFNWRTMPIGMKQYRFQYHDELKQPQAEVQFEALIAFLLDHGAVPSVAGFNDLRSSGLWTPVGTSLLSAPHSTDPVLQVAKSDDSDGILSLSLRWNPRWNSRDADSIPPYWIRIKSPAAPSKIAMNTKDDQKQADVTAHEIGIEVLPDDDVNYPTLPSFIGRNDTTATDKTITEIEPCPPPNIKQLSSSSTTTTRSSRQNAYRLRVGPGGVQAAYRESDPDTPLRLHRFHETHRNSAIAPNISDGANLWFCCAITALAAPRGGLWSFVIPADILALSHRESVPCGVMVLLDILSEDSVPKWRSVTAAEEAEAERDERHRELVEQGRRQLEISKLPFAQQQAERLKEMEKQSWRFHEKSRDKNSRQMKRKVKEVEEAVGSWRVGVGVVVEGCRKWLVKSMNLEDETSVAEVVETWLLDMVESEGSDDAETNDNGMKVRPDKVAEMLEEWKGWAEGGGMLIPHYEKAKEEQWAFCVSACVLFLIKEMAGMTEGNVVSDLQECLRLWKKVRLG
ncbi:hypothetical protein P152DRAFT_461766 [Eremomyces bilateralis CBS 781.70]|uniref:Uncharacterized protein n=1 Tax=Eremomyces bilateralis CBS 781.70 TaxID=1392243 RepID=A0A6G1FTC2_9PEZI|nr:uncharacterized protein P152DRAFT_461766 [Eremomyces bilateralis CBS 781.70]KAF1809125.1 hypothetical protein P152DRAFT_461766 [Eremomyces bilateralis CBS 781.70]